eukprot:2681811-Rhodomonas_salina.3
MHSTIVVLPHCVSPNSACRSLREAESNRKRIPVVQSVPACESKAIHFGCLVQFEGEHNIAYEGPLVSLEDLVLVSAYDISYVIYVYAR